MNREDWFYILRSKCYEDIADDEPEFFMAAADWFMEQDDQSAADCFLWMLQNKKWPKTDNENCKPDGGGWLFNEVHYKPPSTDTSDIPEEVFFKLVKSSNKRPWGHRYDTYEEAIEDLMLALKLYKQENERE